MTGGGLLAAFTSKNASWYVARGAGLVAWALLAASVVLGLALSTRLLGRRPSGPWLLDLHRFLGGLATIFVGLHLVGLFLDSFVGFGLADLFVPLASHWHPLWALWGVLAFWLLIAVEVTSLARHRLPHVWWRRVHWCSFPLFVLATLHGVVSGTDSDDPRVWVVAIAGSAAVAFFTMVRLTPHEPVEVSQPSRGGPPSSLSTSTNSGGG